MVDCWTLHWYYCTFYFNSNDCTTDLKSSDYNANNCTNFVSIVVHWYLHV